MLENVEQSSPITIGTVFGWIGIYLLCCGVLPVLCGKIWEGLGGLTDWLDLFFLIIMNILFFFMILRKQQGLLRFISQRTGIGIVLAILCAGFFYLALDCGLDPFFDSLFPSSQAAYQESVTELMANPVVAFLSVCILAPIVEECLIRGCILEGLSRQYGFAVALIVSTLLFGILHFNFLQTISAIFCGAILGILYYWTGSLLCVIAAHMLYNGISYFMLLRG